MKHFHLVIEAFFKSEKIMLIIEITTLTKCRDSWFSLDRKGMKCNLTSDQ